MKFTKMHGTGNDYVYVNLFEETISDISDAAIRVSDRHFGIGSDGLIAIAPSDVAHDHVQCRGNGRRDVWEWHPLCGQICLRSRYCEKRAYDDRDKKRHQNH